MFRSSRRAARTVAPQRPIAFLHGAFVLPVVAVWIATSPSRYFGFPAFAGIPDVTVERLCLMTLLAYTAIMIGVHKPRLRARVGLEIVLWVLAGITAFSGFAMGSFGPDPLTRIYVFNALIFPAIVVSIILRTRLTERDVVRFAALLALFGIYLGATAIFERLSIQWALFPAAIGDPGQGIHWGRSRGPFLQAAFDGAVMGMLVPVAMLLLRLPQLRWKVLAISTTVLCFIGAYLTQTRAALLALGCVLALGSIVPAPTRAAFRILLATVGLAAGLLFLGGTPVVPRIDEPTSSRDRFDLALASAEMVLAHPVTGVGYGNFDLLQVDFFNRGRHFGGVAFNKEFWDGASHNALLTPFAELGIFVGALNLGFLLSRLLAGLKPISRTPAGKSIYHPVLICGSLMVVAFMVNGVLVDFRNTATPTLLLWSFAALVERYRWTLVASPEPAGSVDERSTPADHAPRIREPAGVA